MHLINMPPESLLLIDITDEIIPHIDCPMPWFGLDIGGTLTKLVYFEPTDQSEYPEFTLNGEIERVNQIHRYLVTNKAYGETGIRDEELQLNDVQINGRSGIVHFIRFPTDRMPSFINLTRSKGFAYLSSTVCATGGGAHKYAESAVQELNIKLHKFDELESLIRGIEFVADTNATECYYWEHPLDDEKCCKHPWTWSSACKFSEMPRYSHKTAEGLQYPYLVVNMGSGISIVAVYGRNHYKRVSGSSIGGGFFHGLCSLLCGVDTFDEAIELATRGDNRKVDKLVRDIYGGDYDLVGLPGSTIAASFGLMISSERRKEASREDLARAALVTVTNNVGSIAMNCARNENIDRILFVGNFLRVNPIAARSLAYAMEFWSQGSKRALFLQHEGYFGAIGCLERLVLVTEQRRMERVASRSTLASSPAASDDSAFS